MATRVWLRGRNTPLQALAALAVAMILLASCTVGPDYVKPTVEAPVAYKEMEGWKKAQPRDDVIRGAWWEIFGDPLLNSLEEQVNISNQNVAAAEAQFRQARAVVQAARSAYYPTVTIGASFTRSLRSSNTGGSSSTSTTGTSSKPAAKSPATSTTASPSSDYSLPLGVSWEADIWGRVRRSVESSRASAQASAADVEATRLLVQAELAQDYFLLRALDGEKKLLDETVMAYQKTLDLTKNRYEGGVAAKVDVLQAEAQLKSTQAQAIDVGVQRAALEHAIALLVGKPASVFSIPFAPLDTVPPAIPAGIPSDLLERRPDIASAERRMAAANAQIGVAVAAYYPTFSLNGLGGFEASSLSKWLVWPSRFWAVGVGVSQTVFDGGLRKAQTEETRAAYDASVASYRETVLTGFQEVEDNLAALRILEEEARVQGEAVKAARQSVVLTTNQYKAGTVSYLGVLVTQVILLTNEKTVIDIQGRRMVASVLLVKALGGGWDASALSSVDDRGESGDTSPIPAEIQSIPAKPGEP